ncbi:MAG: hypothetical protein AB7P09_01515 [Pyrinomonadaceae bacterium]
MPAKAKQILITTESREVLTVRGSRHDGIVGLCPSCEMLVSRFFDPASDYADSKVANPSQKGSGDETAWEFEAGRLIPKYKKEE